MGIQWSNVLMKRIPSWLLLVETAVLALAGVALLSTALSDQATLLPGPVLWAIVVLVALALVASVVELIRRATHEWR